MNGMLCAACLHADQEAPTSGPVRGTGGALSATTLIEGTALCAHHARWWMNISVDVKGVK